MTPSPENKKVQVNLNVQNSIKLDARDPIPKEYGYLVSYVTKGKKYLPFLGRDDNFPNILLDARLISPTQGECIKTISQSVIGDGLILDVENPDSLFTDWLKNVSINDKLLNIVDGERSMGNQFIEITKWELLTKKYMKIELHPFQFCRLDEEDGKEGVPKNVFISNLFSKRGMLSNSKMDDLRKVPLWSSNIIDKSKCWLKNQDGSYSTMLHLKNEVSGIDHYGLPASISGLRYQVLEGKSAQYNLDNFDNNMILGGMLIFKSAMTAEEAQNNAKEILLSHIGEGKTGRIAVVSSENGLQDVDFKEYNTQKDGSFIDFDKIVEKKIITANSWAAEFCFPAASAMGKGSGYLRALWDLKEATLLKPLRKKLIEKVVEPIVNIYAEHFENKEVLKYKFSFNSSMPFSYMADIDPETFMTVDEARKLAGLAPDAANGSKYLSEMKKGNTNAQSTTTAP